MYLSESENSKVEIFKISESDINQTTQIHLQAFPGFFLSELGDGVLRVFYNSLLKDMDSIFYGVRYDFKFVGFFVASLKPRGLYTRLFFKNFTKFIIPVFFSFLRNRKFLNRMIISILSLKKSDDLVYPCALLSICVHPDYSGKGLGKILLSALERELYFRGKYGYYLTTDAHNNNYTNQFYLSSGFKLYNNYTQGTRVMNLYIKDLK